VSRVETVHCKVTGAVGVARPRLRLGWGGRPNTGETYSELAKAWTAWVPRIEESSPGVECSGTVVELGSQIAHGTGPPAPVFTCGSTTSGSWVSGTVFKGLENWVVFGPSPNLNSSHFLKFHTKLAGSRYSDWSRSTGNSSRFYPGCCRRRRLAGLACMLRSESDMVM